MNNNRIPKIIHYCWFGKKDKPLFIKRCIQSWKENLEGYELIEWNESNFNISSNKFVDEAYKAGKYAFVSDYVRLYALLNFGGVYLDTDVEVMKNFDDLLSEESFWGFEERNRVATSTIGAKKNNDLIKLFFDSYYDKTFILDDGKFDMTPNVSVITNILMELGINLNGEYQKIEGMATIYEQEYFSPYDYINCYSKATKSTYAIHHFYKSWVPFNQRIKSNIKKVLAMLIGGEKIAKFRSRVDGE